MPQRHFWWDDLNVDHIAEYGVEPFEAEEVVDNRPLTMRAAEGKYIAYGQTDSGRYLIVATCLRMSCASGLLPPEI